MVHSRQDRFAEYLSMMDPVSYAVNYMNRNKEKFSFLMDPANIGSALVYSDKMRVLSISVSLYAAYLAWAHPLINMPGGMVGRMVLALVAYMFGLLYLIVHGAMAYRNVGLRGNSPMMPLEVLYGMKGGKARGGNVGYSAPF